jgi:hypothetical protein
VRAVPARGGIGCTINQIGADSLRCSAAHDCLAVRGAWTPGEAVLTSDEWWQLIATGVAFLYGPVILVVIGRIIWNRLRLSKSKGSVENVFTNAEAETLAVVTLVHGTFAADAQWTKSDSKLRRELHDLFGEHAAYYRHQWSGHNSFRARREAATALSAALKRYTGSFPRARLFIIAHSHGGNVALKALTPEIMPSVGGLVCLATPVLTARKRNYPRMADMAFNSMGALPSLLVTLSFLDLIGSNFALLIWAILFGVSWVVIKAIRSKISKLDFSERYDDIQSDKVLFMRAPGDEASLGIGAADLLSLIVEKVAIAPLRAAESINSFFPYLRERLLSHKVLTFCTLAALGVSFFLGGDIYQTIVGIILVVLVTTLLRAGSFLIMSLMWGWSSLLLLPMLLLTGLTALAVGPELAMGAAMTYMTAEVCPPGRWTVIQIPADRDRSDGESILQHSVIYESDDALRLMRGWLTEQTSADAARAH